MINARVTLTAEQMAALTTDIVWLVSQTVTLPDGSTETVLMPQVYVRVRPNNLKRARCTPGRKPRVQGRDRRRHHQQGQHGRT
ncbi:MAG: hypothetical protein ACSLEN_14635 [Candidatus Malihini olakiniferum]